MVSDAEFFSLTEHEELTTERESEQINFAIMQRGHLVKDKLQNDDEGRRKSLAPVAQESVAKNIESLEEIEYELDDLNNQGICKKYVTNRDQF